MARVTLAITGMHCEHCVGKVSRALEAVDGVEQVAVFLAEGEAEVDAAVELPADRLIAASAAVGYPAAVKST